MATLADRVKKELSCPFVHEDGRVDPQDHSVLGTFRHRSLHGSPVMADGEVLARKRRQQRRRP